MLQYVIRPIDQWTGDQTKVRGTSPFWAPWTETLKVLERELHELRAKNVVLQCDVEPHQIRQDGMLYANTRLRSSRVILSFDSRHGPLSYPCDKFDDWQHNVRAIALALEALRKVDRYGVTRQAEQYKGWAKLPAPGEPMGIGEASGILSEHSGLPASEILTKQSVFVDAYRKAAQRTHPDAGGNPDDSKRVNAAKQVLAKYLGGVL